jgi:hypothetical protein
MSQAMSNCVNALLPVWSINSAVKGKILGRKQLEQFGTLLTLITRSQIVNPRYLRGP